MIRSERTLSAPTLDALHSVVAWIHPATRLHAVHCRNVVNEDLLIGRVQPRVGGLGRPVVTVLLEGRARITIDKQSAWLEPGMLCVLPDKSSLFMRQEGKDYRALSIEWAHRGPEAARPALRTTPLPLHALDAIEACYAQARGVALSTLDGPLTLLSTAAELQIPIVAPFLASEQERHLTEVLDRLLSRLDDLPMTTDLEDCIGLSSRQLQRVVTRYHERFGFNALNWIDARNRRRLMMAASLMTAPGASVRTVARLVGYSTAESLSRAMLLARYPSPSRIAEAVELLRVDPQATLEGFFPIVE